MLHLGMIVGFRHKGLRDFYEAGTTKGIRADQTRRIAIILADLDNATSLEDLSRPSLRLHELKGERKGTWSVTVNVSWRITFTHDDGKFDALDLEQYH
jgi:proteic killer suppression protein